MRNRDDASRLPRMIRPALLTACLVIAQVMAASAQSPVSPSTNAANCAPTQATPNADGIATTGRGGEALGDKLARSDGVLCPPAGVDPEMRTPPPDAGTAKMPVIPPPGSPGGDPTVRPK